MPTTAKDLNLWTRDPIQNLLKTRLGFSNLATTLILSTTVTICVFGATSMAGASGDQRLTNHFGDPVFLFFAFGYVLLVAPCVFGFYTWQSPVFLDALDTFEDNSGMWNPSSDITEPERQLYITFLAKFKATVDRTAWTITALALSAVIVFLLTTAAPDFDQTSLIKEYFDIDSPIVLAITSIQFLLFFYAMWMIAIKLVASLWCYIRHFPFL